VSSVEDNTQKAYEYYQRGIVHYTNNTYQEAYDAFKQAIALAPANDAHRYMYLI
jgi:tetratricopeptide (TPR) repeat protein